MDKEITYVHETNIHNLNAPNEVVPLFIQLFKPRSVLDVGCGIGTWLKAFSNFGLEDSIGIDGDFVNRELLSQYLATENFIPTDLIFPFDLKRKFDLVISLEVAEHLPESSADSFIQSLVRHSDIVVFSAAIPGQGGQNHLNEQWKEYWINKFKELGYDVYDIMRPRIWNLKNAEWWYKQNMLVFSNKDLSHLSPRTNEVLEIIHPELLTDKANDLAWFENYVKNLEAMIYKAEGKR